MITELSRLKYTEKCLKYIYEFSRTTNKTGATIFTYKIHKANTPYAGLEGCKVGLSLILLSNRDHVYGPKYLSFMQANSLLGK